MKKSKRGTHSKINDSINKYERMILKHDIATEDDFTKIEMANDLLKDLRNIRESFLDEK